MTPSCFLCHKVPKYSWGFFKIVLRSGILMHSVLFLPCTNSKLQGCLQWTENGAQCDNPHPRGLTHLNASFSVGCLADIRYGPSTSAVAFDQDSKNTQMAFELFRGFNHSRLWKQNIFQVGMKVSHIIHHSNSPGYPGYFPQSTPQMTNVEVGKLSRAPSFFSPAPVALLRSRFPTLDPRRPPYLTRFQ